MGITNLQKSDTIEPTVPFMVSYYNTVDPNNTMLLLNIAGKGKISRLSMNGQNGNGAFQPNQGYGFIVTVDGKSPFNLNVVNTNFASGISAPSSNSGRSNALDFIQEIPFKSSLRVEFINKASQSLLMAVAVEYGLV